MAEPKVLYGENGEKLVIFSPSEAERLLGEGYTTVKPDEKEEEANDDGPTDSGATASGNDKPKRSRNTRPSSR